jgi:hypothetical protein
MRPGLPCLDCISPDEDLNRNIAFAKLANASDLSRTQTMHRCLCSHPLKHLSASGSTSGSASRHPDRSSKRAYTRCSKWPRHLSCPWFGESLFGRTSSRRRARTKVCSPFLAYVAAYPELGLRVRPAADPAERLVVLLVVLRHFLLLTLVLTTLLSGDTRNPAKCVSRPCRLAYE